jgi:hypothetical protein
VVGAEHLENPTVATRNRVGSVGTAPCPVPGRGDVAGMLRHLQSHAGNRAVARLIAENVQTLAAGSGSTRLARQPNTGGASNVHPGASGGVAKFNDYAGLVNDFQELAAAALNKQGQGLQTYRLGRDLSVAHRNLLEDVRKVLIDGQPTSAVQARESATADWRSVSKRLKTSLEEARKLGIRGGVIAAVADDIAMISEKYLHVRLTGPSEIESGEDYADMLNAIRDLLNVFESGGEASFGMGREEVPGRADAVVSTATREVNADQRRQLIAVKLGAHLLERHRGLVEKLRQVMVLARSEAAGSAYKALLLWNSIKNELRHAMTRAPTFVDGDVGDIARGLDNLGGLLAKHYELVHSETIATALKRPPKPEEAQADLMMAQVGPKAAQAKLREMRMLDRFRFVLEIIEHGMTPVPSGRGEWLLTSGSLQVRIRDDQAEHIHEVAAGELKAYMAHLVDEMVAAWQNYESIKLGNSSTKLKVLGTLGGAADPGRQDAYRMSVIHARDEVVYKLVDHGEFLNAFNEIMNQKGIVERQVRAVTDYDEDLDVGYNRLARAVQVLEVALAALVPVAGELAVVRGGYSLLTVGGSAALAGTGGAVVVEGTREVVSGEGLDAGKLAGTGRHALAISSGAVMPGATKALGSVFSAGEAGVTGVIGETFASGTLGAFQSKLGGGGFSEGFVGSSIGSLGGQFVKGIGVKSRFGTTVGGMAAGAVGSAAVGDDWLPGAAGGGVGALAGHLTQPHPPGSAPSDGVPVPVEHDPVYHGPAPSDAVPVPVEHDPVYHGPAPSDGVPVPVEHDPVYHGPAPSSGVPEAIEHDPSYRGPAARPIGVGSPPSGGRAILTEDEWLKARKQRGRARPFNLRPPAGAPPAGGGGGREGPKTPVPEAAERAQKRGGRPRFFHGSEAELRVALKEALKRAIAEVPDWGGPDMEAAKALLAELRDVDPQLGHDAQEYFQAMNDPEFILEQMVYLWEQARVHQRTTAGELEYILGRGEVNEFNPPDELTQKQKDELFQEALRDPKPLVDLANAQDLHGSHTHMFHEFIGDRLFGKGKGRAFRLKLANLKGKWEKWFNVWDVLFDSGRGPGGLRSPEALGEILQTHLDFPMFDRPTPEPLKKPPQ